MQSEIQLLVLQDEQLNKAAELAASEQAKREHESTYYFPGRF